MPVLGTPKLRFGEKGSKKVVQKGVRFGTSPVLGKPKLRLRGKGSKKVVQKWSVLGHPLGRPKIGKICSIWFSDVADVAHTLSTDSVID